MNFFTRFGRLALLVAAVVGVCVFDVAAQEKSVAATFTDKRDGRVYRTVKMPDGKTWMAENLNHKTGNSWCYEDNDANCKQYGRLYDWNTAKTACPAGWHLPSKAEWDALENAAGGNVAGKNLKAAYGWENNGGGTDGYGFSALPGGYYYGGSFYDAGNSGDWWTATEDDASGAYLRNMYYSNKYVCEDYYGKSLGFSVRCLRD